MPYFQPHKTTTDSWDVCQTALRFIEHRQIPFQNAQILPHIREEYDFKNTNRLLAEKINCPRRNKLLFNSIIFVDKPKKVLFESKNGRNMKQIPSKRQQWIQKKQKRNRKSGIADRSEDRAENRIENETEEHFSNFEEVMEGNRQNREAFIGRIKRNINSVMSQPKLEELSHSQEYSQEQSEKYSSNKPTYRITRNRYIQDAKEDETGTKLMTQPGRILATSKHRHKQNFNITIGRGDTEIIFSKLNICSKPEIAPETLFILEVNKIMHSSGKENVAAPRSVISSAPARYSTLSSAAKEICFAFRRSPIELLEVHILRCKGILCERVSKMEINLDQFKENLSYQTANKGEPVELQGKRTSNTSSGIMVTLYFKIRLRLA